MIGKGDGGGSAGLVEKNMELGARKALARGQRTAITNHPGDTTGGSRVRGSALKTGRSEADGVRIRGGAPSKARS